MMDENRHAAIMSARSADEAQDSTNRLAIV